MITNNMYNNEINYYPGPYGSNNIDTSNFGAWGHFSQLVWTSTAEVGCATQYCPNGLAGTGGGVSPYFTVCDYNPAGKSIAFPWYATVRLIDANRQLRWIVESSCPAPGWWHSCLPVILSCSSAHACRV
jgi:hypothetical protein